MTKEMSQQRAAVLVVLHHVGRPMRLFEIADATRMKYSNVAMMLLRMRSDGQIEQTPCGRWQVTANHESAPWSP
jgi:DNA-binding IclR family transcriptional regulator